MSELEISDRARWAAQDEMTGREWFNERATLAAARVIVAAELRRMADKTDGECYCILKNRADELDPPGGQVDD